MVLSCVFLELSTALLISIVAVYIARQTILSPLKNVPGPYFAKLTNIYQLVVYFRHRQFSVIRSLHARYGTAVRIGPNHVSLNDLSLLKKIYDMKGTYAKVINLRLRIS